jgi:hypothetical protein
MGFDQPFTIHEMLIFVKLRIKFACNSKSDRSAKTPLEKKSLNMESGAFFFCQLQKKIIIDLYSQ